MKCKCHLTYSTKFCVQCNEIVCRKCKLEKHSAHNIVKLYVQKDMDSTSKENYSSNDEIEMLSTDISQILTINDDNSVYIDDKVSNQGDKDPALKSIDPDLTLGVEKLQTEVEHFLAESKQKEDIMRTSNYDKDEEIKRLRKRVQTQEKQISDMSIYLAQQESEKTYILNVTSSLGQCISEIEGMDSSCNYLHLDRQQNEIKNYFTEQIESVINRFIAMKNNMIKQDKKVHDKILEVTQWTNRERECNEERSRILRDTKEKLIQTTKELEASATRERHSEAELNNLRNQNGKLQQQAHELQQELEYCKKRIGDCNLDRQYSTKRMQEWQTRLQEKQKEVERLLNQMSKQEEDLQSEKKAKEDLQSRLSSIAGDRLTKGNPAITDLGDPNRPMRTGEMYSELYDNEWTDALELADSVRQIYKDLDDSLIEEIVIRHLHKLLKVCYTECLYLSQQQVLSIRNAITEVLHLNKEEQKDDVISSVLSCRDILNYRKQNASKIVDAMLQNEMLTTKIDITDWEYSYKNHDLVQRLIQTSFFTKCVRLCWYMVLQEPVMHLGEDPPTDSKYDKNLYREFLKGGDKVKYVVWPPLFLHEAGPILCKGVIQAYS